MTSNEAILQLVDVVDNCVVRIGQQETGIIILFVWLTILSFCLLMGKIWKWGEL